MKMENLRKRGWRNSVKTRVRSVQENLLNLNEKDSRQSLYQNALFDICVSINVKPECGGGGGGPRVYVGQLTSFAFPTLRNLTNNLSPQGGGICFFKRRN